MRPVRAFLVKGSVLLLSRVWLVGRPLAAMAFPLKFYLKFWDVLGNDLVLVLNSAFRLGSLSRSQRRGIITLAFKKGDRLDPKNWRQSLC